MFFQLKELEKLAPKTKGIGKNISSIAILSNLINDKNLLVTQSVKEVLQSLIDNDLVSFDKIGTSNCK